MLVEAHAGREREVGTQAHEHPAPLGVGQVKVVLVDPASRVLEMPAIALPIAVRMRAGSRPFTMTTT